MLALWNMSNYSSVKSNGEIFALHFWLVLIKKRKVFVLYMCLCVCMHARPHAFVRFILGRFLTIPFSSLNNRKCKQWPWGNTTPPHLGSKVQVCRDPLNTAMSNTETKHVESMSLKVVVCIYSCIFVYSSLDIVNWERSIKIEATNRSEDWLLYSRVLQDQNDLTAAFRNTAIGVHRHKK